MTKPQPSSDSNGTLAKIAATAVAIGAAALTAKVLSDPDNRENISNGLKEMAAKATETAQDIKNKTEHAVNNLNATSAKALEVLKSEAAELVSKVELASNQIKDSEEYKQIKLQVQEVAKELKENFNVTDQDFSEVESKLKANLTKIKKDFEELSKKPVNDK